MTETDELVTFREIARRVEAEGIAPSMSHQRVSQLARNDPAWPVPRDQWKKIGTSYAVPWKVVRAYFVEHAKKAAARDRRRRPKTEETDTD